MKCQVVQRRLLSLTHPERVPADLRAHLIRCAACREWHNHLLLLESHVPLLPIPASNGKAKLLRQLLSEQEAASHSATLRTQTHSSAATLIHGSADPRGHSRTWLFAMAAALLLIAVGWLVWQARLDPQALPPSRPVAHALLASLVQRDLRLAGARTPRERIEILAAVAEDLHGETGALAHAGSEEELTALATLYEEVVQQGILKQAEALPAEDRRLALVVLSQRMAQTASRVEQLARDLPAACAKPLHAIAATARSAQRQLHALTSGGNV